MDTRRTRNWQAVPQDSGSDALLDELPVAVVRERPWQVALETLRIRSSWVGPVQQPPTRLIRRYQETDILIQKTKLPVRFFGYAPVFRGSLIYPALECDWAIMNLAEDPFYNERNGKLVAPRSVKQDLSRFHEAGLCFDTIFIAHEIPKGAVKPGQEVPLELIAPRPAREVLNRLPKTSLWDALGKMVGAAATQVSTGIAALAAPGPGPDPVLFGVQFDPTCQLQGHPIGMWYYLTHWFWD